MASFREYLDSRRDVIEQWPVQVSLIGYTPDPFNTAAASARTCYSSKGILLPSQMEKSEKSTAIRDRVAKGTYKAGHHTTRQHSHFIFGLQNVSRYLIHSLLHSHPYYNSEQVSQRYVPLGRTDEWFTLPPQLQNEATLNFHNRAIDTYRELVGVLKPVVSEIYFSIHRLRARKPEKYEKDIEKKAMEVARYIMPLSTTAYLYHTISTLTLYRYVLMSRRFYTEEAEALILQMAMAAMQLDPLLERELPVPLPPQKLKGDPEKSAQINAEFDDLLNERSSVLVSSTGNPDKNLQNLIRFSPGLRGRSIRELLANAANPLLGEALYPVTLDPDSRNLNQIHFTFAKKLSHTADSQEQRHRTLPGTRHLLPETLSLENDYITPSLIKESERAGRIYHDFLGQNYDHIREHYKQTGDLKTAAYLLPNAHALRYHESGDLLNFYHKWKARLCYNAQEEIFYSALDEVSQLREIAPETGATIGPPCHVRTHLKPRCPEGDHFCGIKVWQLDLKDYKRIL